MSNLLLCLTQITHHDQLVALRPGPLLVLADLGGPLGPHEDLVPGVGEDLDIVTSRDLPEANRGQGEAGQSHTCY